MAVGGIFANWGLQPPNLPFPSGTEALSNTVLLGTKIQCYLGPTKCPSQMASHSISRVHKCDTHTVT